MESNQPESWEELYVAAVLEPDLSKVADRIEAAQMRFASAGTRSSKCRSRVRVRESASRTQSAR